jgi:AAA+ ATPase superfamily predicted ATPase
MEIVEHFFNRKLRNRLFYPRKLKLPRERSFILYGARGVGKTVLIIDFLRGIKSRYLYIDADEPLFIFDDMDSSLLNSFIKYEEIELLIIDHFYEGFLKDFPSVNRLILVSRERVKSFNLPQYELLPLDYEEFLGFDRFYSPQTAFNHFLKLGTLPKVAESSLYDYPLQLKEIFLEKFDTQEARLILVLAKFHSRKASINQIYIYAKEYFKISKDWTYRTLKAFESEGVVYTLDEVTNRGVKKILLYDFALARYLNRTLSFNKIFDSIVSLSLIKHQFRFATFENIGYVIFGKSLSLIMPSPFESREQLKKRILRALSGIKRFNIVSVAIVTVSNRYYFDVDGVHFEALPFYEWSIIND